MKISSFDLMSKFFMDCGKLSFAVLVIGVIAHKPFVLGDFLWGTGLTLILFFFGVILNEIQIGSAP